jgi:hypothetical protein
MKWFQAVQNIKGHWASVNGTSLQGYINANYVELLEAFGEPTDGDGYKVDAEWVIVGDDGTVATIYNWKDGRNYCGRDGMAVWDIRNWHIGGHSQDAVDLVHESLNLISEKVRQSA